MKNRQGNDATDCIVVISIEYDTELSNYLNRVRSMTKTRKYNNVTDRKDQPYTKNETELS